jgi:transposase
MGRHELTDAQWERLTPLLPPRYPGRRGRPYHDHRRIINGMLWIAKTGAPWRDLPEHFGPWQTVATRFYRWKRCGLWARILAEVQRRADARGELDWEQHYVDGTVVRAHQHAAGAPHRKGGQEQQALGRSRGGFSTKLHLRAEGGGKPLAFLVTAGQRHEQSVFEPLMERGAVRRAGRGRPRHRPRRVVGDKGYSSRKVRCYLAQRGIGAVIPRRANEPQQRHFERDRYRERNRVERLINRLKQFRRVATRYEKLADSYVTMVTLAAILLWIS